MRLKAIACLLLCFVLISAILAGCADNGNENSSGQESVPAGSEASHTSEPVSTEDDPYRDEAGIYSAKHLPAFDDDWKSYEEFRVLVYSDESQKTYYSEEIEPLYDTTDQAIIDGVNTRNAWISDNYGITVRAIPVPDVLATVRAEMSAYSDMFDAAMPFMSACAVLSQEGVLYDLCEFSDYIDLDAPWWDDNATKSMSIGDRVYFTTGDMSIMQKIVSSGVAFNKTLLNDHFPGVDLYQIVDEGKWTLDRLYSMSKEITTQLVDDGVMDENDLWGCVDTGPSFFYGSGEQLVTKDADNKPMLSLGSTQRSIDVAQKVLTISIETKTWLATVADWTDRSDIYGMIVKVFGEDRSLFMLFHFSAIKKLRPYDAQFGIIPAAKYDEEQDGYFTKCSAYSAYGTCLPLCVKDPEFSAYMCELMAIGGKNSISNAYYNVVLKGKDIKDEASERMLDLIFNNILYDPAIVYGFSGLNNIFTTLISKKSTDISSTLESMKDSINLAIDEVIDAYENY